jgi:hypothetical protein
MSALNFFKAGEFVSVSATEHCLMSLMKSTKCIRKFTKKNCNSRYLYLGKSINKLQIDIELKHIRVLI